MSNQSFDPLLDCDQTKVTQGTRSSYKVILLKIVGRTLKCLGFLLIAAALACLVSIPVLAMTDPSFELGFVLATFAAVLIVVALIPLVLGYFFMALSRDT